MKKFISWFVQSWRASRQWRIFTYSIFALFYGLEILIQVLDRVYFNAAPFPIAAVGVTVFYFVVATPIAYAMRNNP